MKEINPRNRDLIIRSVGIAFGVVVLITILRIASKLLLLVLPIAVVVFLVLKIMENRK